MCRQKKITHGVPCVQSLIPAVAGHHSSTWCHSPSEHPHPSLPLLGWHRHCVRVWLLEGSAQRLLEHAGDGEGLLSWRRLVPGYELATAGGETSLLLEVLAQTFKGDVRASLDEFDVKIQRYERTCGDFLSDRVAIAVVLKGIEDDDLRRHLLMHAARLSTHPLVREEMRSIIMARDTLTGPAPMDVSAVYKGRRARARAKVRARTRTTRRIPRRTLMQR